MNKPPAMLVVGKKALASSKKTSHDKLLMLLAVALIEKGGIQKWIKIVYHIHPGIVSIT